MTDKTFSADEAISEAELDALRESAKKRTYLAYALAALAFPLYWWLFYTHEFADGGGSAMMKNAIAAAVASAGTFGFLHTIVARHRGGGRLGGHLRLSSHNRRAPRARALRRELQG